MPKYAYAAELCFATVQPYHVEGILHSPVVGLEALSKLVFELKESHQRQNDKPEVVVKFMAMVSLE